MPEDRTQVGGVTGSFNTTDTTPEMDTSIEGQTAAQDTRDRKAQRQAYLKQQEKANTQAVEQHSPTQVHVPAWKTIVLGGSGGIRVRS
jgi:hypothetical protein